MAVPWLFHGCSMAAYLYVYSRDSTHRWTDFDEI
jgi:hypothetical protein